MCKELRRKGISCARGTIKRKKANWIGHNLHEKFLIKHIIEVKIEGRIDVTKRQGRSKQLLSDLQEGRGY